MNTTDSVIAVIDYVLSAPPAQREQRIERVLAYAVGISIAMAIDQAIANKQQAISL